MSQILMATLSKLAPKLKLNLTKPMIENLAFKLHHKATALLLITFVVLVSAAEYYGAQIKCIPDKGVSVEVINTYCFFMATFTIARYYDEDLLQIGELAHPGVGPLKDDDEILHHTFYQWVPFVLFIQAVCFYMPHYIWKKKEGGKIQAFVTGLQNAKLAFNDEDAKYGKTELPSKKTLQNRIELIRKEFILRLRISKTWAMWLVAMEVTNLVHIILEIWITNIFLNKAFIGLGPKVIRFKDWDNIIGPLESVFPKVTKCSFHKYGPSGTIQKHDALCLMVLNTVYEKIYAILWFWFFTLFIVSIFAVAWRVMSYFVYRRSVKFNEVAFRKANSAKVRDFNVTSVVNGCTYWDWLFLYYLAKNMNGFVFQELFKRLAEELENKDVPCQEDFDVKQQGVNYPSLKQVMFEDETLQLKRGGKKI